jgi:hypothetical protein
MEIAPAPPLPEPALPLPDQVAAPAPMPPVFIPIQEPEPALPGPRRSSRISNKTNGMYAIFWTRHSRKKRDAMKASSSKRARKSSSSASEASSAPPPLLAEQLIQMGRECGFDEKEEGELLEAASQAHDE